MLPTKWGTICGTTSEVDQIKKEYLVQDCELEFNSPLNNAH